jgi:predicted HD superfamily hydrolase involved in NAD metabolism
MRKTKRKVPKYLDAARRYVERNLEGRLLEHTRGCVVTAEKLARKFGLDVDKAATASYLHDIAKSFSKERQVALALELGMPEDEIASYPPPVLHGSLSALVAQKELGIEDAEVLQAIVAHSTGCAGMCDIAKVVFIADYIEVTRRFPAADDLRSQGNITLNEFTRGILMRKVRHLVDKVRVIDTRAVDLWNDLVRDMEE